MASVLWAEDGQKQVEDEYEHILWYLHQGSEKI